MKRLLIVFQEGTLTSDIVNSKIDNVQLLFLPVYYTTEIKIYDIDNIQNPSNIWLFNLLIKLLINKYFKKGGDVNGL